MKILIYSYFPPLKDHLAGGAQRFLDGLLKALPRLSIEVRVLCPSLPERALLPDGPHLRIIDELAVVDNDPLPAEAHRDLLLLDKHCRWADLILTIDRHFPLEVEKPVVLCLNNFSYGPETRSAFGLNWDAIVVPSDYLRRCLHRYFGADSWLGSARPIHVISCGVSSSPSNDARRHNLRQSLGLPDHERYLAFPHRPDPDKGFETAVRAVIELRRMGHKFTLLVPSPRPGEIWPHQRAYLQRRVDLVKELDAEPAVRFHRWIQADEMATYLSIAEWSLCLSELPEGFGLVILEALMADTPVVATMAGAVPELLPPEHGVELVEFGDHVAAARVVAEGRGRDSLTRGQAYIRAAYDWGKVANDWMDILALVKKSDAMYAIPPIGDEATAPWLRTLPSGRIWHDNKKGLFGNAPVFTPERRQRPSYQK